MAKKKKKAAETLKTFYFTVDDWLALGTTREYPDGRELREHFKVLPGKDPFPFVAVLPSRCAGRFRAGTLRAGPESGTIPAQSRLDARTQPRPAGYKKMKILMVAPQPFFTPRGTPFSVYYRIWVACELGHQVDLLTYGQGNSVEVPGCRVIRIPAFHWLGPVGVGPSLRKLFMDFFMVVSDREGARAMGRCAQQWYREKYSRTVYTTKMVKLLSLVT